jgi:hypothetical protein
VISDAFLGLLENSVLASAPNPLRGLFATEPRLRLVRPGEIETATAFGVVLLDRLPGVLVTLGEEVLRRG